MKIQFLGTSAGWPLPRLGCRCDLCVSSDPKDTRTRSQILVNEVLLLDIGIDTYLHLSKLKDPTTIRYGAISHEHPDHTFGLWDFGHIYESKKPEIFVHKSTYQKIRHFFFYKEYLIHQVEDDQPQKLGNLNISLLKVAHTDSSFGILVEEDGKRMFYAPDFRSFPKKTQDQLVGVELLILEGSELSIDTPSHQSIDKNIRLAKDLNAKMTYFTHLGHRTLPHQELEKYVSRSGNFSITYDGLEINL